MAQRPLRRKEKMMAVCSFIGYEEIFDADIESRLQLVVDQIVAHHESAEFLIYPRGKFYYICLLAALRAKMRWPQKVTVTLVVLEGGLYINVPDCAIDRTVELHFDRPKKNDATLLHKKLLQWLARKSTHLITCVYDQLYDPDRQSNKITALYCRIGKPFDMEKDTNIAHAQIDRLSRYARKHGLKNPKFFCDWGYSGATSDRPEYQRMLQEVVSGRVANLVVLNLSRLDRDCEDAWKLIGDTLPHYGVAFHSVQDGADIEETLKKFSLIRQELEAAYRRSQEGGRV